MLLIDQSSEKIKMINHLPMAAILCDRELNLTFANPEALRRFPFIKLPDGIATLVYPNEMDSIRSALENGDTLSLTCGLLPSESVTVHFMPAEDDHSATVIVENNHHSVCDYSSLLGLQSPIISRLRAPLAVCFSAIRLTAKQQTGYGKNLEYLPAMQKSCYQMLREVVNMSAYSALSGGISPPDLEYADYTSLVRSLGISCKALLSMSEINLALHLPEKPLLSRLDPKQLTLAIVNIIANAAKFGALDIQLSLEKSGEMALLSISDNGDGIPESIQDRIFSPCFSHSRSADALPGSGLGLAIAKLTAITHSGAIAAKSTASGTTVAMSIPIKENANTQPKIFIPSHFFNNRFSEVYIGLSEVCEYPID